MSTSESLSVRLQRARSLSGVSARALSRLAGLAEGHVSLIEADRPKVEARTAAKLALALGVTMEWLVSGVGEGPSDVTIAAVTVAVAKNDAELDAGAHAPDTALDT